MTETQRDAVSLTEVVHVEPRFMRSADIVRDHPQHEWLPPFRFSQKSVALFRSLVGEGGQLNPSTALIGPYGSGKSLVAVALMALLDRRTPDGWAEDLQSSLRRLAPDLSERIATARRAGGYICVGVEASPDGVARPLLTALQRELAPYLESRPRLRRQLGALLRQDRDDAYVAVIQEALEVAVDAGCSGILLVVDEFGRVLEGEPKASTKALALIQEVAELAERMDQPRLQLLVMIHQNFQDYTTGLSPGRRKEWAKVQGRFQQVSYQAEVSDLYAALAASIDVDASFQARVRDWAEQRWAQVEPALGPDGQDGLSGHVASVWPLDPITAFLLPRLSVAVGQNERSTYAFLSSADPRALRAWVARQTLDGRETSLQAVEADRLFDFFAGTEFGAGLPRKSRQILAQARIALEQLADGSGIQTRLVKVIAGITLARDYARLRTTFGVVAASLASASAGEVRAALQELTRRAVLVYREHSGEYLLHPGSGIDVDELVAGAVHEAVGSMTLSEELVEIRQLEPIVAHRLTFEEGTTRSYAQSFALPELLVDEQRHTRPSWKEARGRPDGRIRYVLAVDDQQVEFAHKVAPAISSELDALVVPTEPLAGLPSIAAELTVLRRLQNTPGSVAIDSVARHELAERVDEATAALERTLSALLNPGAAVWYLGATPVTPRSQRDVQVLLSHAAAAAFSHSPSLHNELINRRELSSAAVVATKLIVERLLGANYARGFGFAGNGPEVSISRALFEKTGILKALNDGSQWGIGRPEDDGWKRVWEVAEEKVRDPSATGCRVVDIWDVLARPPYGIRAGVLPLFTWALLVANRNSVCLFEKGSYIPVWSVELYDRMARWPEEFAIRHLPMDGVGSTVVSSLDLALPKSRPNVESSDEVPLNRFLAALFGWYRQLPEFAKRTLGLSDSARALRGVLNRAKDPVNLVCLEIPEALGFSSLVSTETDPEVMRAFAQAFQAAVEELDGAYSALLQRLIALHTDLLGLDGGISEVRDEYGRIRAALAGYALQPSAASFLLRAADNELSDDEWCVSVASAVEGTPPNLWSDAEERKVARRLAPLVREALDGVDTLVRLGETMDNALPGAARVAVFRDGQAVIDIVSRHPLSSAGEHVLESLESTMLSSLARLPASDRSALAARLVESILAKHPKPGDAAIE